MKKSTVTTLKKLGVPPHLLGHDYIGYAAELLTEDRSYLRRMTKALYPKIAEKFGTTAPRVERAIRHAIEVSVENITPDEYQEFYGNTVSPRKDKPVNSQFLAAVANMLEYPDPE